MTFSFESRLPTCFLRHHARLPCPDWSLVAQGDRILALDQRGQLFLIRANKEKYQQRDKRKLTDSETRAHLAVAGDQLFVRELNALSAWRLIAETAAVAFP